MIGQTPESFGVPRRTTALPNPSTYVHPIHFEDFDGFQFERLVFAYYARAEMWRSLEWYGQTGSDLGRDIWGLRESGQSVCIQCVNRSKLTFAKVKDDLAKVVRSAHGVPDQFRIVARGSISADMRDKIRAHVQGVGVGSCSLWSGQEFEEFLRFNTEPLLRRFIGGQTFPDSEQDLKLFALEDSALSNEEILAAMAKLFDRPAFYTPIQQESNLPDFKQAITDTIQALGTGIWKDRDGHIIGRIASRHQLRDVVLSQKIQSVEMGLARLRAKFDEMLQSGAIRSCGCGDPDCPTYMLSPQASDYLERLRDNVLKTFQSTYPMFQRRIW
jgi:hypothetical protein